MANISEEKRYGLIPAKKTQLSVPRPSNIFSNSSESDSDNATDWVKKALKDTAKKGTVKKQTQLDMQRALKEDPTIYQYDEVYDEIQRDKSDDKEQKKEAKKPRYIQNLLKTAERRKIEQERRIERMVHKEREAEGAEFADKESFITSAYKAKLEEFKKLEKEEERMDRLEAIADVTKQADMTGFYRHLYRQKVERISEDSEKLKEPVKEDLDRDDVLSSDSDSVAESDNDERRPESPCRKSKLKRMHNFKNKRQYRKRVSDSESESSSQEEEEEEEPEEETEVCHESDHENEPDRKKSRVEEEKINHLELQNAHEKSKVNLDNIIKKIAGQTKEESEIKPVVVEMKFNIWEKRCHGDLFEEAVRRYFERKAERMSKNIVY